jgi:hypothetical protein
MIDNNSAEPEVLLNLNQNEEEKAAILHPRHNSVEIVREPFDVYESAKVVMGQVNEVDGMMR